jgi:tyrosinase
LSLIDGSRRFSFRTVALQVRTEGASSVGTLKTRESVTQLSDDALGRFVAALQAVIDRPDNRGFQFYAGWHGVPFDLCEHHVDLFLPWHRGYLYHFELALQDVDADVTLPWWNWMDESGIPASYTDQVVLRGSTIRPFGVPPQQGWPEETFRDPGAPQDPAPVAPPLGQLQVGGGRTVPEWLMQSPSWSQFRQRLERLHDNIHVWVGGTMTDPEWAAYDPLFWAHHSMVDRLWRIWQHNNPGGQPPLQVRNTVMTFPKAPSLRVEEVLDVKQLGYEYAAQTDTVAGPT